MENSYPTRVNLDNLARAEQWQPWPNLLESEPRPPITEPPTEEVPFIPDPAGSDESDDDEDTDEIELSAEDRYQDNCAICHSDSCDC